MKTKIILVGGFLGAGKTTLLAAAARKLQENGKRVGLITNDQAAGLVDTAFLRSAGAAVEEVSGSCFCCNFDGFMDAVRRLGETAAPDVIVAEPVGSCTDLSATILQPLKAYHRASFDAAPLSVLVDPGKLESILAGGDAGLDGDAAYILSTQLEEADAIVLGKADLLDASELGGLAGRARKRWPEARVYALSARTGAGVDEWLSDTLERAGAGRRIAVIDYDRYARGEAVLGWLNAAYGLSGPPDGWNAFLANLLAELKSRFDAADAAIGHVKALVESEGAAAMGNLVSLDAAPAFSGEAGAGAAARLTLNARVQINPADLERIVADSLGEALGAGRTCAVSEFRCLSPGRPNPTHRFRAVV